MIEFKNENDIKYIKVRLDNYEETFLLESKLTIKGIQIKVKQSLINEKIYKSIKEIIVISFQEAKEKELLKEEIKVSSYTAIGIHIKWALSKNVKPMTKIEKIFEILNKVNAFYNDYEIHFKNFGTIQFINSKLNINIIFDNSEDLFKYIKNHFSLYQM